MRASSKTAALAGAWWAFGMVPIDFWMDRHRGMSVLAHNLIFIGAAGIFFFVPGYLLVIGRGNASFKLLWFMSSEERTRYRAVVVRILIWFLSAAVVVTVWSLALMFVLPGDT
jgi:hypothetical protein